MTPHDTASVYHRQAQKFFEQIANDVARQTQFVQRRSPLDGRLFLLSLLLTVYQYGYIVLEQLAVNAEKLAHGVQLTGQAFKARMNGHAVAFLQAMLVQALQWSLPNSARAVALLDSFKAVYLLDSSVIALPETLKEEFCGCGGSGAKAAVKLFLLLNYLSGAYETLRLEAGRKADQNMGEGFLSGRPAGALWLFDLGFFKLDFLAAIAAAKSYYLCRLYSQLRLFVEDEGARIKPFDLDQFLLKASYQLFEIAVWMGPQAAVGGRLIVARVPARVAVERRRKFREKGRHQGRTPKQTTLRRMDWTLIVTNASQQQLPTSTVLEVYRVRWQVELAFKLAKSELALDKTQAREKYRVQCEFYAKLVALLFFNRLSGVIENLKLAEQSAVKAFRRMRGDVENWQLALGQRTSLGVAALSEWIGRHSKSGQGKKKRTTRQRVQQSAQEARQVELSNPLSLIEEQKRKAKEPVWIFSSSAKSPQEEMKKVA